MTAYQTPDGRWRYRARIQLLDGTSERISGTAPKNENTKAAAEREEREHMFRVLHPPTPAPQAPARKELPTYEDWFKGRFWKEWVIAQRNKPSERASKECIFRVHLQPRIGMLRLDEIDGSRVQQLRAELVETGLSDKRIGNILVVLSKSLHYANEVDLIDRVPKFRIRRGERPEIVAWDFDEYPRLLDAARAEGPFWYAAICLCGEAGLRIGEVRALRWREDVDMVGRTLTVNHQLGDGLDDIAGSKEAIRQHLTTPKGGTRRTIPMTTTLYQALTALEGERTGYVLALPDGSPLTDSRCNRPIERICGRAELPVRYWHTLRHTFGTHAARFGVNPFQLMRWMGHKRMTETLGYVHLVEEKPCEIPPHILAAGNQEIDPTKRVIAMLGARAGQKLGQILAFPARSGTKSAA